MSEILSFVLLLGFGCIVLWPKSGLLCRWLRLRTSNTQVLLEDALKHLYDCKYHARPATLQSLSGALGISGSRTAGLVSALEKRRLVRSAKDGPELTAEGCSYALQVIRTHRLWEQYLADHTGTPATAWHAEADRREHLMSSAEAEILATKLGNPRYDPHGDAIPTVTGEIPAARGQPLASMDKGQLAMIVHVEDEPEAVYAQLVAKGLAPGMQVRLIEASPEKIRFEVDGKVHSLSPVVAANLTAVPLFREQENEQPFESLAMLQPGEMGKIIRISPACRGVQLRRLLDLGFVPNTVVEAELRSPSGDPTAYRVRGSLIALRKEQANLIQIARQLNGASQS